MPGWQAGGLVGTVANQQSFHAHFTGIVMTDWVKGLLCPSLCLHASLSLTLSFSLSLSLSFSLSLSLSYSHSLSLSLSHTHTEIHTYSHTQNCNWVSVAYVIGPKPPASLALDPHTASYASHQGNRHAASSSSIASGALKVKGQHIDIERICLAKVSGVGLQPTSQPYIADVQHTQQWITYR